VSPTRLALSAYALPNYLIGMHGHCILKVKTQILVIATRGWTVRGSNPVTEEILRTRTDRPWDPHFLLYNEQNVSFPEVMQLRGGVEQPPPT